MPRASRFTTAPASRAAGCPSTNAAAPTSPASSPSVTRNTTGRGSGGPATRARADSTTEAAPARSSAAPGPAPTESWCAAITDGAPPGTRGAEPGDDVPDRGAGAVPPAPERLLHRRLEAEGAEPGVEPVDRPAARHRADRPRRAVPRELAGDGEGARCGELGRRRVGAMRRGRPESRRDRDRERGGEDERRGEAGGGAHSRSLPLGRCTPRTAAGVPDVVHAGRSRCAGSPEAGRGAGAREPSVKPLPRGAGVV